MSYLALVLSKNTLHGECNYTMNAGFCGATMSSPFPDQLLC